MRSPNPADDLVYKHSLKIAIYIVRLRHILLIDYRTNFREPKLNLCIFICKILIHDQMGANAQWKIVIRKKDEKIAM
jgi:hypothetical protein